MVLLISSSFWCISWDMARQRPESAIRMITSSCDFAFLVTRSVFNGWWWALVFEGWQWALVFEGWRQTFSFNAGALTKPKGGGNGERAGSAILKGERLLDPCSTSPTVVSIRTLVWGRWGESRILSDHRSMTLSLTSCICSLCIFMHLQSGQLYLFPASPSGQAWDLAFKPRCLCSISLTQ